MRLACPECGQRRELADGTFTPPTSRVGINTADAGTVGLNVVCRNEDCPRYGIPSNQEVRNEAPGSMGGDNGGG